MGEWIRGIIKRQTARRATKPRVVLSLAEVRYVLDEWRLDYNHRRLHSALDWQTPAAFAATLKPQDDRADGAFSSAMQADPTVGAAPLPPDQPARTTRILSQGLVQES